MSKSQFIARRTEIHLYTSTLIICKYIHRYVPSSLRNFRVPNTTLKLHASAHIKFQLLLIRWRRYTEWRKGVREIDCCGKYAIINLSERCVLIANEGGERRACRFKNLVYK